MSNNNRTVCPIPRQGDCVYERCNFWDEEKEECSGASYGEYEPLEETGLPADTCCTVYWTEDFD